MDYIKDFLATLGSIIVDLLVSLGSIIADVFVSIAWLDVLLSMTKWIGIGIMVLLATATFLYLLWKLWRALLVLVLVLAVSNIYYPDSFITTSTTWMTDPVTQLLT